MKELKLNAIFSGALGKAIRVDKGKMEEHSTYDK